MSKSRIPLGDTPIAATRPCYSVVRLGGEVIGATERTGRASAVSMTRAQMRAKRGLERTRSLGGSFGHVDTRNLCPNIYWLCGEAQELFGPQDVTAVNLSARRACGAASSEDFLR